jgi:hypothetical protein
MNAYPLGGGNVLETMHMIRKGQLDCPNGQTASAANQFYSLAA